MLPKKKPAANFYKKTRYEIAVFRICLDVLVPDALANKKDNNQQCQHHRIFPHFNGHFSEVESWNVQRSEFNQANIAPQNTG
jgi:hypothetical protein